MVWVSLGTIFIALTASTAQIRNIFEPVLYSVACEKIGICEDSPDYPYEHVKKLLAQLPAERFSMFNRDVIQDNGDNNVETIDLCKPSIKVVYPDKVKTKLGKWVYIINPKGASENKIQGFISTTCSNPESDCGMVTGPPGYTPVCKQEMSFRSMYGLNETGHINQVSVPVASCCLCELRSRTKK